MHKNGEICLYCSEQSIMQDRIAALCVCLEFIFPASHVNIYSF
jgi:hypothetical protein